MCVCVCVIFQVTLPAVCTFFCFVIIPLLIVHSRLLKYSPEDGQVTHLMDGLMFANGVQLTRDQKSVLVADTMAARIYK